MSTETDKSAIREVRDQLSLDFADGNYLDVITANLGLTRPPFGFTDDTWRAIAKALALQYKQVLTRFHAVLEIVLGPQVTQCTGILADVDASGRLLQLADGSGFPQTGVAVLDEGTAAEETVEYSIILDDLGTHYMYLDTPLTNVHLAVDSDTEVPVFSDVTAGAVTVVVGRGFSLPTDFPYTLVLGRGTPNEEVVRVSSISGNTLTLAAGVVNDHQGFTPSDVRTELSTDYVTGSNYVVVASVDNFPPSGWLALRAGTDEIVEFIDVDYDTNQIFFANPLTNAFVATNEVELLDTNETAKVGTVQVKGVDWDVFQVTPRRVDIYLPDAAQDINTVLTASYLHGPVVSPVATTTTALANLGDTTLSVTSTTGLPNAGVINLGAGAEHIAFYVLSGTSLAVPTGLKSAHAAGTSVALYQPAYAGTDLMIGDQWGTDHTWSGPYLYDNISPTPEKVTSTLAASYSGPVGLMLSQPATKEALEVADASAMPSTFPFTLRVGYLSSQEEDINVLDKFLREDFADTVSVTVGAGATTLTITPGTNLPLNGGFRLLVDYGGAREQVVYVTDYDQVTGAATIESPTALGFTIGDPVVLMADILEVEPLQKEHTGAIPYSQRTTLWYSIDPVAQERVVPVYSQIDLVSSAGFPTDSERVILNMGNGVVYGETTLTVAEIAGSVTLDCADTSVFPTTYPYWVVLNPGGFTERRVRVTNNNTGTNQLTVDSISQGYAIGTKVAFYPGAPETVTYNSVSGNSLVFSTPIVLQSTHWVTEPVNASGVDSVPDPDGFDWPFRLPLDILARLEFILDLIRAAGVQVNIITQR